jgi:hypothetical protein
VIVWETQEGGMEEKEQVGARQVVGFSGYLIVLADQQPSQECQTTVKSETDSPDRPKEAAVAR